MAGTFQSVPPLCSCLIAYRSTKSVRRLWHGAALRLLERRHPQVRQTDQEMVRRCPCSSALGTSHVDVDVHPPPIADLVRVDAESDATTAARPPRGILLPLASRIAAGLAHVRLALSAVQVQEHPRPQHEYSESRRSSVRSGHPSSMSMSMTPCPCPCPHVQPCPCHVERDA